MGQRLADETGRTWRAWGVPLAAGLAGSVAVAVLLGLGLVPRLAETLLPHAAGAVSGLLLTLGLRARSDRAYARSFWLAMLGAGVSLALVTGLLAYDVTLVDARHFGRWTPFVGGLSLTLWLVGFLAERRRAQMAPVVTALLAGLAFGVAVLHNAQRLQGALDGSYLRTWNVYHYYVGSKYFPELGYRDLYAATLAADDAWQSDSDAGSATDPKPSDGSSGFAFIDRTRDMQTYTVVTREAAVAGFDDTVLSDARFDELGRDTRWLRPRLARDTWRKVFLDWGYNPTPAWTVVGVPLSNAIDLGSAAFRLLVNLDLLLFAAMFAAVWWAFGLRSAVTATLWVNLVHFNRGRLPGGFLQYDWLASAVLALCLYRKDRPVAAGLALSWGAMTRGFVGLVALPILIRLAVAAVRKTGPLVARIDRRHWRFTVALAIAASVWFGASHLTGRGSHTWLEWVDNIVVHAEAVQLDPMQVGVGRLAQHQPKPGAFFAGHRRGSRDQRLAGARFVRLGIQLVGGCLFFLAGWRRRDVDAMVLALAFTFFLATVTRYYGTAWVVLLLLGVRRAVVHTPWPAWLAGIFLLTMPAVFYAVQDAWARYTLVNYEALVMLLALAIGYATQDWLSWRRGQATALTEKPIGLDDTLNCRS